MSLWILIFMSVEEMSGKLKVSWLVSSLTFPLAFLTGSIVPNLYSNSSHDDIYGCPWNLHIALNFIAIDRQVNSSALHTFFFIVKFFKIHLEQKQDPHWLGTFMKPTLLLLLIKLSITELSQVILLLMHLNGGHFLSFWNC